SKTGGRTTKRVLRGKSTGERTRYSEGRRPQSGSDTGPREPAGRGAGDTYRGPSVGGSDHRVERPPGTPVGYKTRARPGCSSEFCPAPARGVRPGRMVGEPENIGGRGNRQEGTSGGHLCQNGLHSRHHRPCAT